MLYPLILLCQMSGAGILKKIFLGVIKGHLLIVLQLLYWSATLFQ